MLPPPAQVTTEQAALAASMGIDPGGLVPLPTESPSTVVWPEHEPVLRLYAAADSQRRGNGALDFRVLPLVARLTRAGPLTAEVFDDVRTMDRAITDRASS